MWVNGSGTGNRALPSGRGFQNRDFIGHSLLNLWYSYYTLTCGRRPQEEEVARRSTLLERLRSVVQRDVDDQRVAFRRVAERWEPVREEFDVFLAPGPQLRCPVA